MNVTRQRASVRIVPSVSCPTPYIGSTMTLSPARRMASRSISASTASTYSLVKSLPPDQAALQRDVQVDLDDLLQGEPVRLGLNLLRLVVQQQRAVAVEDLEAVPLGRIVAGGKGQAIGGLLDAPWRR